MGASVQMYGKDAVITAYESRELVPWSLWQSKMFLTKFDGIEEGDDLTRGAAFLETFLDSIKHSSAVYTLCVYEDLTDKIKSNTAHAGSFNFKFHKDAGETGGISGADPGNNAILSELAIIRQRLDSQEQDADENGEDSAGGLNGVINGIFQNPQVLNMVAGLITRYLPPPVSGSGATQTALNMAGVSGVNQVNQVNQVSAAEMATDDALAQAIGVLKFYDPLLSAHLMKLAKIASESPATYQQLVSMLKDVK